MASSPNRFGGHISTAACPAQQRRYTAPPLMRVARVPADVGMRATVALAQQYRSVVTGRAYTIERASGSESVDSDGEGYSTDGEETAALINQPAKRTGSEGKGMGRWFHRRATDPIRKSSKQWFRGRSVSEGRLGPSHLVQSDRPLGVEHIEEVGESQVRVQEIDQEIYASGKKTGVKRKFSKRLSRSAASVKSFGKMCASKVRKVS